MADQWKNLYQDILPGLAAIRDPVQHEWPIFRDHCFARVILDNAVGIDRPWMEVVQAPAVKNMNATQFSKAIELANKIASGEADLAALNQNSLRLRGKTPKEALKRSADVDSGTSPAAKRVDRGRNETISKYFKSKSNTSTPARASPVEIEQNASDNASTAKDDIDMNVQNQRILDSDLTDFRKLALRLLCQIPRGRYSTYQAMSDYITKASHKTCARAVGNSMRNNPFAPEVPCHRVLASDGTLGGFKGHWGVDGKFANEKHKLLYEEGVKFDSQGKVRGSVFRDFTLLD